MIPIKMISRDVTLLKKSVEKIWAILDLDVKVNNSFDVFAVFRQYMNDSFENKLTINTIGNVDEYDNKNL